MRFKVEDVKVTKKKQIDKINAAQRFVRRDHKSKHD